MTCSSRSWQLTSSDLRLQIIAQRSILTAFVQTPSKSSTGLVHSTMSTIASPRASTSIRSPSSTRTSFDASARPPPGTRRNRAALRDYYGLKSTISKDVDAKISEESTRTDLGPEVEEETLTELDGADFNAEAFVNNVLATSGLSGVLKVEADLVSRTCSFFCPLVLFERIVRQLTAL